MSYYFLDNPNPNGQHFYTSRRGDIRVIVIHTAENLPDFDGDDTGAEAVARYGSRTSRGVSWHAVVDSDSVVPCLPDDHTAWHVRGYNSASLGLEIATQAHKWGDAPDEWVEGVIENAAQVVRTWCKRHDIPVKRLTKRAVDAGKKGIVPHSSLDSQRRSDPGRGFPWDAFLAKVVQEPAPKPTRTTNKDDVMSKLQLLKVGSRGQQVKVVQDLCSLYGEYPNVDGIYGPETERAVRHVQANLGASVDGIVGPETWGKMLGA